MPWLTRPRVTASGSTTKNTAAASRSCWPTASAATRACGSRTSRRCRPATDSSCGSRVRALLIIDSSSASGLPLGVDNVVLRAKSIEVTLKGGMDAMAEFAIQSNPNVAGRIKLDPSARKEIFDYYRMLTPIGYANALRALLQMDYITDRLSEITVPTLLVCGDEDPSLGPMREIQKRIPHARFALLPLAGHFANRDRPEAFNRAVVEFLSVLS